MSVKLKAKQEDSAKAEPSLEQRILAARAEAEKFIDALAAKIKERDAPGIPIGVIKGMVTQHSHCACAVALKLMKDPNYA